MVGLSKEAKSYWKAFGVKVLENFASVKVWFFLLPFVVSSVVLGVLVGTHVSFIQQALKMIVTDTSQLVPIINEMKLLMDMFIAWCTFNVSLAGTVIIVRETFKVQKLKALNLEDRENTDKIEQINP